MLDLFLTPGWKHVVDNAREQAESLRDIRGVKGLEDLYYRQGQVLILDQILTLEAMVRATPSDDVDFE